MQKFFVCLCALVCGAGVAAAYGGGGGGGLPPLKRYKVTVVNLTKGQPLTPPVIAIHRDQAKMLPLGHPASEGLADLAQDGTTELLKQELRSNRYVYAVAVGKGVIMPGEKSEIIIEARFRYLKFSVFSMLARTNDAFIYARASAGATTLAPVYDAGVEHNSEDCAHIPAPPCGNHNVGTDGGEGFVRFHEGLHLTRDLNGQRDTFANIAAKVIVARY